MNEILPLSPAATHYKDRSTGLTLFGVATVLLGGLCALMIPLMLFGQVMAGKTTGIPPNFQTMILAAGMYGGMAVLMVWLGIGSMLARRWARALLLIFAGTGLLMGLMSFVLVAFLLPQITKNMRLMQPPGQPALPENMVVFMVGFGMLIAGVIYVVLPGIWTLFYRSPHVKATCEARDPVERWTDRCPIPVLTISVWLAISVPMVLLMPLAFHGMVPFFGVFLSGVPGSLIYVAFAAVMAYCAWAVYRLDPKGWWVTLISFTLLLVSGVISYLQNDLMEMYRQMGFPEQQAEQMQQIAAVSRPIMIIWSLFIEALLVGSLLYVKKHFWPARPKP